MIIRDISNGAPPGNIMKAIIIFDPKAYSERTLRLILKKAEEWSCTPGAALSRLLDQLADQNAVPQKDQPAA